MANNMITIDLDIVHYKRHKIKLRCVFFLSTHLSALILTFCIRAACRLALLSSSFWLGILLITKGKNTMHEERGFDEKTGRACIKRFPRCKKYDRWGCVVRKREEVGLGGEEIELIPRSSPSWVGVMVTAIRSGRWVREGYQRRKFQ